MSSPGYRHTQDAITKEIYSPHFQGSLPPLSEAAWAKILEDSHAARNENDRMEFVGDAFIGAAVSREFYRTYPQGTPHLYTCLKGALVSNLTFFHLARNFSFCALKDPRLARAIAAMINSAGPSTNPRRPAMKKIADFFETVIAAYCAEAGFERLCDWVGEFYPPLIRAGQRGYNVYLATRGAPQITPKKKSPVKLRKSMRRSDPYPVNHNHFMRVVGPPLPVSASAPFRTQGWPYLGSPAYSYSSSVPNLALAGPSNSRPRVVSGPPHPPRRSFIDLTLLSDDEDERENFGHIAGDSKASTTKTKRAERRRTASFQQRRSPSVITISSDSEGGEDELQTADEFDEDEEDSREVEALIGNVL